MAPLLLAIALSSLAAEPTARPVLAPESVLAQITLSEPAVRHLRDYRREQSKKKGPPAPCWLVYQLRALPAGLTHSPQLVGMLPFPSDRFEEMRATLPERSRRPLALGVPNVPPGLWQLTIHLQNDAAHVQEVMLTGWICLEVKPGDRPRQTTLELSLIGSLDVVVDLDRAPDENETLPVAVCFRDANGLLVDLVILEMTAATETVSHCFVPEGPIEVQAVVMTDVENIREARRSVMIEGITQLRLTLKRPPKVELPAVPRASGGRLFIYIGRNCVRMPAEEDRAMSDSDDADIVTGVMIQPGVIVPAENRTSNVVDSLRQEIAWRQRVCGERPATAERGARHRWAFLAKPIRGVYDPRQGIYICGPSQDPPQNVAVCVDCSLQATFAVNDICPCCLDPMSAVTKHGSYARLAAGLFNDTGGLGEDYVAHQARCSGCSYRVIWCVYDPPPPAPS